MKILQVDVNYDHSSTGKIVKDLQHELQQLGHDCLALYGRGSPAPGVDAIRIASPLEVMVHAGLTRVTGLTGYFSPLATSRAKKIIDVYQPDVVHFHEPHGYYINYENLLRYVNSKGIRLVWTFHCEFGYTGKCGYALDCERWRTGCGNCPQLHLYPRSAFFDATAWMFQRKRQLFADLSSLTITTPSEWLSRRARESIARSHPVKTIPNPIDNSIFYPRSRSKAALRSLGIDAPIVVITVGSQLMTDLKGGRLIYELGRSIRRSDVHFLLVGVEPAEAGRVGNVTAIERVNDKNELALLYSACDLLCLPSQKETFSMVCAESLACGTPVIGFDSGAPPFVAPPEFGRFAPFPAVAMLADWVENFEETRSGLRSAEDCARFAALNYGRDTVLKEFMSVYESNFS